MGVFSYAILPKQEKKKKEKKKKPEQTETKPEKGEKKQKLNLTAADIRSAVPAVWESLRKGLSKTGSKMTIDPLRLSVIFGGDDPADTAEWYGWASSALWTLMPQLQEKMRIPHPQIHLGMDFQAEKTKVEGKVRIRYRVGGLVSIGAAFARPVLKWFMAFRKKQKQALPKNIKNPNNDSNENAA